MNNEVLIVGAGLAGLCCARKLHAASVPFRILEASDAVGGRIRTDVVDGFRLDRGFQVFLTSYPEAKEVLDYDALNLKSFLPGALIRYENRFHEMTDPWRRPLAGLRSVFSPIGSLRDKTRVAAFRAKTTRGSVEEHWQDSSTTALAELQSTGFSSAMIERFFQPFFGGIFLERELRTSNRMLNFLFRMFALGNACLPAEGMEAIPRQLAATLPPDSVQLNKRVTQIKSNGVILEDGQELSASSVVVATEGPAAAKLLGEKIHAAGQGTTCFYFAAPKPPIEKPILVLNGEGGGPINNLCVPTVTAPKYGPGGESLVSVTVLGTTTDDVQSLADVRTHLGQWFGRSAEAWRHLKTYSIPYALPAQLPDALEPPQRDVRWQPGIYVCGDHRDNASINGAMVSGRRAAEAVLQDRS